MQAAQRLGRVLAGIGTGGLAATLDDLGLANLVGATRFDVLDALITLVSGHGGELDEQAARDAACDVLDLLYGDAESFEELDEVGVSQESLVSLLVAFLAAFVCNRIPVLAERLANLPPAVQRAKYAELQAIVAGYIQLDAGDAPFSVDWEGDEGRDIIESAVELAYEQLAAMEEDA